MVALVLGLLGGSIWLFSSGFHDAPPVRVSRILGGIGGFLLFLLLFIRQNRPKITKCL